MDDFKKILLGNLAKRKVNKTLSIYMILSFLENIYKSKIKGILKNDILYIKAPNPHINFDLFLRKREIINQINNKLSQMGYNFKIKDIRKLK